MQILAKQGSNVNENTAVKSNLNTETSLKDGYGYGHGPSKWMNQI